MTKEKFQDKYRIESNRNQNWDYSSPAHYFITICTANREHYFGEIVNSEMNLSKIGKIAYEEWLKTPGLRPDMNIHLDEFCIMPNHFHAIIGWGDNQCCRPTLQCGSTTANREHYFGEIVNSEMNLSKIGKIAYEEWLKTPGLRPDMNIHLDEFCIMPNHFHAIIGWGDNQCCRPTLQCGSTTRSALKLQNIEPNKFGPQSKNLGAIIRGFKSSVKTQATVNNINFAWQPNYHDHIIRNEQEFKRIKYYIRNNPKNW
ncbi:MAG: hypothetical protein KQH79_00465 [Bacteroidetes bacterium]|nr:hypothetical protein [Bacteroidota bacterium]